MSKAPKAAVKRTPAWDAERVRSYALDGWESLKQSIITIWVDFVPQPLQAVIHKEGVMTIF